MQDIHSPVQRLDYENLDVYRCAIEFLAFAFQVINSLQRGDGELRDQLKRAAISVVLNIAEGAGKPSAPDRARFHAIARGSAMECGALVDVCDSRKGRPGGRSARQGPAGQDCLDVDSHVPVKIVHAHVHAERTRTPEHGAPLPGNPGTRPTREIWTVQQQP